MSKELGNLQCGNDPEELFDTLKAGLSVYIFPCRVCHKTLISIDHQVIGNDQKEIVAFFKCVCGKKYRKTVMTLEQGYLCKQGRVHILPERMHVGAQGWSNPNRCYVSFPNDRDVSVHYVVTRQAIILKKGLPTDA